MFIWQMYSIVAALQSSSSKLIMQTVKVHSEFHVSVSLLDIYLVLLTVCS